MEQNIVIKRARAWADSPLIAKGDRRIVQNYLDQDNQAALADLFSRNLSFGTGGIRAPIGPGSSHINLHTIGQVTQSFATVLKRRFPPEKLAVCIGFDCRKFSSSFARKTAQVMAAHQIRVYLFDHITPTPILSYAIKYHRACGGVMITASHNPQNYNGYKAYGNLASQLTPPDDEEVVEEYKKLPFLSPLPSADFEEACNQGMISFIDPQCEETYYQLITKHCFNPSLCQQYGKTFPIAFTPLHGTGGQPILKAFKKIGLENIHTVQDQQEPDENFPTVEVPNPEEPKALAKLLDLMEQKKTPLALATDPDGDRLGAVVAHEGKLQNLNGNQIALILLHYILTSKKKNGTLKNQSLVVNSIVSSELTARVARAFGCKVESTLPGFKWICQKIGECQKINQNLELILGTEESFGYLAHDYCLDKDGIHSSLLMAEAAIFHHSKGRTLIEALNLIYEEYGYSRENLLCLYYPGLEGSRKIQKIMQYLRTSRPLSFPEETLESCRDFLDETPSSNILEFNFSSGNKLYARPSGTEPKIKFYTLLIEKEGTLEEKKKRTFKKSKAIEEYLKELCQKIS